MQTMENAMRKISDSVDEQPPAEKKETCTIMKKTNGFIIRNFLSLLRMCKRAENEIIMIGFLTRFTFNEEASYTYKCFRRGKP